MASSTGDEASIARDTYTRCQPSIVAIQVKTPNSIAEPLQSSPPDCSATSSPDMYEQLEKDCDRGRKRYRQTLPSTETRRASEQKSKSRSSLDKLARSLSRDPSAHTGVHFLGVKAQAPTVEEKKMAVHEQVQCRPFCHWSYEDQKHYTTVRWLEASHK